MPAYRIYGDSISGNCLKVKWTADYLGADYEWVETSVLKSETRTDAFLKMNRQGQVPLLQFANRQTLAQSGAILLFLNERHGGDLLPEDPMARAEVFQWMFWEQNNHEPYIAGRRFQKTYLGKADDALDPKLLERGSAALGLMEEHLTGRAWMAGDRQSLADIALVAYTREAHEGGFDLTPLSAVRAWIDRVEKALSIAPAPSK